MYEVYAGTLLYKLYIFERQICSMEKFLLTTYHAECFKALGSGVVSYNIEKKTTDVICLVMDHSL